MENRKDVPISNGKPKYLYKAHSYLNNFYSNGWRYSDVSITWYRVDNKTDRFNSEYIKDYTPGCLNESAISELFTLEEVERLEQWLKKNGQDDFETVQFNLPIWEDICTGAYFPREFKNNGAMTRIIDPTLTVTGWYETADRLRYPEPHDFFIAYAPHSDNMGCFYCGKEVAQDPKYQVIVMINNITYDYLCDDCAKLHATKLHSALVHCQNPLNELERKEPDKIGSLMILRNLTGSTRLPCPLCEKEIVGKRPFAIQYIRRGSEFNPPSVHYSLDYKEPIDLFRDRYHPDPVCDGYRVFL